MRKIYSFLVALLVCGTVFSQNLAIDFGTKGEKQILENSQENLKMRYSFKGISTFKVKTSHGTFNEIAIPETYFVGDIGTPKLPAAKDLIEIPFGAEVSVKVISYDVQKYNMNDYGIDNQVMPQQFAQSKSDNAEDLEFQFNNAAYESKQMEGYDLASVEVLGTLRGMRLARLEVRPVKYNASTNEIEVYNNVEVAVEFKNADIDQTIYNKAATYSIYFEPVYEKIINRSGIDDYPDHPDLVKDPIKMLVVSDRMFEDQLQPFFEWKTKCGFELIVAYTDEIGGAYNDIKTWIHDQYAAGTPADPAPSFILLVGDSPQIPMEMGSASGKYTDLYYASVDGDIFPEMYYARFSAENEADLQPQIDKTLYYEQYLFEDPSYLDRVTLIAGADGTWNPRVGQATIEYGTENYFNAAHGYTEVNDYLTSYSGCYSTVNTGLGFINYTAHCGETEWSDPHLSISDVNSFTNTNMFPLAVGNCCLSNNIGHANECIGETWMRKENAGAVNYIGSAPSSYWWEDFYWGVGAFPIVGNNDGYVPTTEETTLGVYDAMWLGGYYCVDAMIFVGNLAVTEADSQGWTGSTSPTYYWQAYMCNGDPSNVIYNTQGGDLTVSHMDIMPIGVDFYEITANPGSYVGISKDGVLHGAGLVGETGVLSVDLEPIVSGGDVDIVVTAPQMIPYVVTVPAAALDGPYLILDEYVINDPTGNNNQLADTGEDFTMDVTVKNVGSDPAASVVATISGTDTYVTLNGANTIDFGNITNDESATVNAALSFSVANNVPDGHTAQFEMSMTDGTDTWTSMMNIKANAPVLAVGEFVIDDSQTGNDNGRIDPGETFTLKIQTNNDGACEAVSTIANIITSSPYLTLNDQQDNLGTVDAGASATAEFSITANAATPMGTMAAISFDVASGTYIAASEFEVKIGMIVEDWESGDLTQFDWAVAGDAEWFVQTAVVFEGENAIASGDIDDNQSTEFSLTVDVLADDVISFYYKVSSEGSYDKLKFYIDGSEQASWSGEVDWALAEFSVSAGTHTFKWEYSKDSSADAGEDMAWVDFIEMPAMVLPDQPLALFINSTNDVHCIGGETQLFAIATGGEGNYTYTWTPAESLSAANISNPFASPEIATTYSCVVSDGTTEITAEITLDVAETPEALSITIEGNVLTASEAVGYQWYDDNGPIDGATSQTYTFDHTSHFWCVAVNVGGCESEASNVIWDGPESIDTEVLETSLSIYPNPTTGDVTNIILNLKENQDVKISVYNTLGSLIRVIEDSNNKVAGEHSYPMPVNTLQRGMYIVVLETKSTKFATKLVVK
ncbi:MAG: T9SS type A sorting domain-containing protein [Bacteroidales bacterium]|nr:T9SS type A sorting domain-containing protein [Bacteroidales bacterium]